MAEAILLRPLTVGSLRDNTSVAPTKGQITPYSASNGALAVPLPPLQSLNEGAQLVVRKFDASANVITFNCAAGDTFSDGVTTSVVLKFRGSQKTLQVVMMPDKKWTVVGAYDNVDAMKGDTGPRGDHGDVTTVAAAAGVVDLSGMLPSDAKSLTLSGNISSFTMPPTVAGKAYTISLRIVQPNGSSFTVPWAQWKWTAGGTRPFDALPRTTLVDVRWTGFEWVGLLVGDDIA